MKNRVPESFWRTEHVRMELSRGYECRVTFELIGCIWQMYYERNCSEFERDTLNCTHPQQHAPQHGWIKGSKQGKRNKSTQMCICISTLLFVLWRDSCARSVNTCALFAPDTTSAKNNNNDNSYCLVSWWPRNRSKLKSVYWAIDLIVRAVAEAHIR